MREQHEEQHLKAVVYARFSSELQHERSIDDQVALCRQFAAREGLQITSVYADRAKSGASILGREGLMQLIDAARDGTFDIVVVEALDRLSRDQEDLAHLYKRLKFQGIDIRAVHDGWADPIQIGVRGLVGALYLQDLAHKVRRGLAGRVAEGKRPGGRPYGYDLVAGKPGELAINPVEAATIRTIFSLYTKGESPRAIAATLNGDRIRPPRGARWNASTINGSRQRGNGILHNELYVGRLIWNRLRMIKDPDTGKRVSRLNRQEEWRRQDVPVWRIIDDEAWTLAQARTADRERPAHQHRRPKTLLSGLLKCGVCGGGMALHDKAGGPRRVRCTRRRESGECSHERAYRLVAIEQLVVQGLREQLRAPELIAQFVAEYRVERARLNADRINTRIQNERRLTDVNREIERIIDSICDGTADKPRIKPRLAALGTEKDMLEAQLAEKPDRRDVIDLHPGAVARYLGQIEALAETVAGDAAQSALEPQAAAFRELVECVIVHRTEIGQPLEVEIRGRLAALTDEPRLPPCGRIRGTMVVAADGFEPPTKGL